MYFQKYLEYKLKYSELKGGSVPYKLTPETLKFINSLAGSTPIYELNINEARKVLETVTVTDNKLDADVRDIDIEGVTVTIVKPLNNNNILTPIIYIHGGGWILGNKHTHDRLIRDIAVKSNSCLFFVNYTPSPEARYPVAINQVYKVMLYLGKNYGDFNIDINKLVVMGDSVGGNMSIAVVLKIIKEGGPKVKYVILAYPVISNLMDTESYDKFKDGPWLSKKSMEWFFDNYLGDNNNKRINYLDEDLRGFPKTLLMVDENDVLRDEGELFAHKLMDSGVDTSSVRILGTCHDFLMLDALRNTYPVRLGMELILDGVKNIGNNNIN
jgi:acetyl esterase